MAINIKELFSADSDNSRLDKINYNFDQIVANGGGPVGLQGVEGEVGPQGIKGDTGLQGLQGIPGNNGVATDYFIREETQSNYILSPVADPNHTASPSIVLGDIVDGSIPLAAFEETPLYLKRSSVSGHAAAVRIGTDDTDLYVDFQPNVSGSFLDFNFLPGALSGNVRYKFKGAQISLNVGGIDKVLLGDTSTFNGSAVFNAGVKISTGAGVDKYLRSDAAGNASWQTLGTAVPIGTLVMVPRFVLLSSVDWNGVGGTLPSVDYIGKGTGVWDGWYYCWGRTWGTYETPDMRERYPIGYINSNTDFAGTSNEAKNAAAGEATHSTSGTSGYFGTNDIDGMQAKQTAAAHTHNVTVTPVTRTEPDFIGNAATYAANTAVTTTSTSAGSFTTDVSSRSAVLGFMIYLGPGLTYTNEVVIGPGL